MPRRSRTPTPKAKFKPSSTATLYQRCYERQNELAGVTTLREAQSLLKQARGKAKELPPSAKPSPTPQSTTVADLPQLQRGDQVQIQSDDDLNGSNAIVAGTETDEHGNLWVDLRVAELSGMALDYRAEDLKFIAPANADSLFELGQLMEQNNHAAFVADLQSDTAADTEKTEETAASYGYAVSNSTWKDAVDWNAPATPPQSKITPDQRVAEQLILQFNTSILEVTKRLLKWCNDDELGIIEDRLLDEKARRKGFANYEEFAAAKMAEFFPRKEAS